MFSQAGRPIENQHAAMTIRRMVFALSTGVHFLNLTLCLITTVYFFIKNDLVDNEIIVLNSSTSKLVFRIHGVSTCGAGFPC
jgi:hypothetical protein